MLPLGLECGTRARFHIVGDVVSVRIYRITNKVIVVKLPRGVEAPVNAAGVISLMIPGARAEYYVQGAAETEPGGRMLALWRSCNLTAIDIRDYLREPSGLSGHVTDREVGAISRVAMENLSLGGAMMTSELPIEPGSNVELELSVPNRLPLTAEGVVVYRDDRPGNGVIRYGVKFTRLQRGVDEAVEWIPERRPAKVAS